MGHHPWVINYHLASARSIPIGGSRGVNMYIHTSYEACLMHTKSMRVSLHATVVATRLAPELDHCQSIIAEPCVPWLQLAGLSKPMSKVGSDATSAVRCGRQEAMHKTRYSESLRAFCEGSHGLQDTQHDALAPP